MQIRVSPQPTKPIDKWSNRDFLLYFSNLLLDKTGRKLEIPPEAWKAYLSRMKGFRNKLGLSNVDYKAFVDLVFSHFFIRQGYVPAFGAIVSEQVYAIIKARPIAIHSSFSFDFEKARDELYRNNQLFQRIPSDARIPLSKGAL